MARLQECISLYTKHERRTAYLTSKNTPDDCQCLNSKPLGLYINMKQSIYFVLVLVGQCSVQVKLLLNGATGNSFLEAEFAMAHCEVHPRNLGMTPHSF